MQIFSPYAGYSKAYVKNHNYENESFDPTFENLIKLIPSKLIKKYKRTEILNLFCGGTINLKNEKVETPFPFKSNKLIQITDSYVKKEGLIKKCDTYRINKGEIRSDQLNGYLKEFNEFTYHT